MTKMAAPIAKSWKLFARHKYYLLSGLKNVNPGLYPRHASSGSSEWGFLYLLNQRGVLEDILPESGQLSLSRLLHSGAQTVYCGFDPTADSLHIGNLLPVIALMHFRNAGHNVVAVIGEATAQIGDPCGKPVERDRLSVGTMKENARGVRNCLQRLFIHHELCFSSEHQKLGSVAVLNNASWYRGWSAVSFLSEVGRHFRMGALLSRHGVQSRLKSAEGLNLTEFTYQLLQAYDFYHLHQHQDCRIQVGGADQLGNIASGQEFIHKMTGQDVYGLTVPLVASFAGDKLGKTAGNALWLDRERTSPFELFQYFLRQPDSCVERYLRLFTFLSLEEVGHVMEEQKQDPGKRSAQRQLAEEVTRLVHGEDGVESARRCTDALYHGSLEALQEMSDVELQELFREVPVCELVLEPRFTVLDVCRKAGAVPDGPRGSRMVKEGAVWLNHCRVDCAEQLISQDNHILANGLTLLRVGKRNFYILKWLTS
uniref:Tyrosine--tRNA ligase n=2 Tax=Paramormyrops kingsleyae TaxID=1676925 RepID=A0A3B3QHD2_9TELE